MASSICRSPGDWGGKEMSEKGDDTWSDPGFTSWPH
jgi:hypothetical protein